MMVTPTIHFFQFKLLLKPVSVANAGILISIWCSILHIKMRNQYLWRRVFYFTLCF